MQKLKVEKDKLTKGELKVKCGKGAAKGKNNRTKGKSCKKLFECKNIKTIAKC